MVLDSTLVVVITQTAAINVVIRIFRRALVLSTDLPPYQAARKQPPITPALARSLSRKNATMLSNSQDRPATLLIKRDRKSTRLNSSHRCISYAVFCLKKKKQNDNDA